MDRNANRRSSNAESGKRSIWEETKRVHTSGVSEYVQRLFINLVVARDEKHIFLCSLRPPSPTAELRIECGVCGASFGYPDDAPLVCNVCNNRMQRFALS